MMYKIILLLFFIIINSKSNAQEHNLVEVEYDDIKKYWDVDDRRMSPKAPDGMFLLFERAKSRNGQTFYQFEFTIDANGIPKDFLFFGSRPEEGKTDEKLLKQYMLYKRYKPSKTNKDMIKVKVKADLRIGNPFS